ncbi:YitT family protein [Natranaerobius thermophilus]|uniref:DUF2179 domain-containing protein n=1 Tax=Natranaerobius thermophilus (strain ATCC BAA-1301 / DSM 18059 / JW/NM-WN-LF) TaxID=457570 RepID=B2A809_NATTJ|nr:YitT family protein [Natranaerobius thermophilus]ACB85781.1 protein of unknown function DUF161 [Natranaerobius thermophilus JW/NM-WN-LF]
MKKIVFKESHKKKLKELILDFIGIAIGCAIAAAGMNAFLIPNQLAAGGVSGLGIVLLYVLGIPVGLTVLAFNIPLLIAEGKIMGVKYTVRTIFGAIMFSVLIEAFTFVPDVTGDIFLSAIYGGLTVGLGLGIVFRNRGTTGGTALAAQLLQKFTGLTMGQGIVGFDMVIIATSAIFFGAEIALYALVSLFVSSKVIDMVEQGFGQEKAAFIISNKSKEISEEILHQLGRGVTNITAKGGYTGEDREVLFAVVSRTEISKMKYLVYSQDENAFLIVTNASEVMGEGFKAVDPEEL